jgi:hypothetical protein
MNTSCKVKSKGVQKVQVLAGVLCSRTEIYCTVEISQIFRKRFENNGNDDRGHLVTSDETNCLILGKVAH